MSFVKNVDGDDILFISQMDYESRVGDCPVCLAKETLLASSPTQCMACRVSTQAERLKAV